MSNLETKPDEEKTTGPPVDAGCAYRPPQPSILHFFFWTAGSSLVLAFSRGGNLLLDPKHEENAVFLLAASVLTCLLFGAAVGSLAIALGQWMQNRRYPVQPGEWLLLTIGCGVLLIMLLVALSKMIPGLPIATPAVGAAAGSALLAIVAAIGVRKAAFWCVFFVLHALWLASLVLPAIVEISRFDIILLICLALWGQSLLVALVYDFRMKNRRGWLHWTGLGVLGGLAAILIAVSI